MEKPLSLIIDLKSEKHCALGCINWNLPAKMTCSCKLKFSISLINFNRGTLLQEMTPSAYALLQLAVVPKCATIPQSSVLVVNVLTCQHDERYVPIATTILLVCQLLFRYRAIGVKRIVGGDQIPKKQHHKSRRRNLYQIPDRCYG